MANIPADLVYLIGHDDLVSFGSSSTEFMTAPGYAGFLAAIGTVMDCNSSLAAMEVAHEPM